MNDLVDRLPTESWVAYAGIALLALGGGAWLALIVADPGSAFRRRLSHYEAALDRELSFLLARTKGATILRVQIALVALGAIAAFLLEDPFLLVTLPFVVGGPLLVLKSRCDRRRAHIERQLDGWLMILSNALKAAPSLGEALATSANLCRAPMSEEIDLVLKEVRLGSPTDQALLQMAGRVRSRVLWGAVATLLVGRQTGGDVSRILEESADALREMARLDGVVKTKTADGRSQAYVLAAMPFLMLAAIHFIDPAWLVVLGESFLGYIIIAAAGGLWLCGFLAARKILAVDV